MFLKKEIFIPVFIIICSGFYTAINFDHMFNYLVGYEAPSNTYIKIIFANTMFILPLTHLLYKLGSFLFTKPAGKTYLLVLSLLIVSLCLFFVYSFVGLLIGAPVHMGLVMLMMRKIESRGLELFLALVLPSLLYIGALLAGYKKAQDGKN